MSDTPSNRSDAVSQVRLEDLTAGAVVGGVVPTGDVTVVAVKWYGSNAVNLTYRTDDGVADQLLYRDHETRLVLRRPSAAYGFDGDGALFKMAAEALRIRMAARFDPMLAVTSSDLEPLPHQIQAVYGELLDRTPLRFVLADDPGAGKTIMAGLYVKELMLRGDLERCLVVAPGGLVEQWQDELLDKFGLRFELLTRQLIEAQSDERVFARFPLLIARMDQLSRSDELQEQLQHSDWDLVVVDEAHRMSARYFGDELKKTKRYQLGELLGGVARHLLLMTATPHAGNEADFQLFVAPDGRFGQITDNTLLIRPDLALTQYQADKAEAEARSDARAGGGGTMPTGDSTGSAGGSRTSTGGASTTSTSGADRDSGPQPGPKNVRFYGAVQLNPELPQKSFTKIYTELVQHLSAAEGTELELILEITAKNSAGIPEDKVRIVSENARVLKFDSFGFEDR